MKPLKIFYMLLATNIMVFSCAYFFPAEGLRINHITLRFANWQEWVEDEKKAGTSITEVLPNFNLGDLESDTSLLVIEPRETDDIQKIEFSQIAAREFHSFFQELKTAGSQSSPLRILHYGDSQIEGDRITSVLREEMQAEYGGAGPGMIPVSEPSGSRSSIKIEIEGNWERKQVFGPQSSKLAGASYGVLGFSHSFSPPELNAQDSDTAKAQISLSPMYTAFKRASTYSYLKVLYRNAGFAQMTLDGAKMDLDSSQKVALFAKSVPRTGKHEIDFTNNYGLQVFAILADDSNGVAVDNIAIRGSSGLVFTQMNRELLSAQYQHLNVGLIIYQYGINVVPYVKDDYSYYQRQMTAQLRLLKSLNPGVPVLVVGVSDMSRKEGSNFQSYPNLSLIIDAQKQAAKETGCAFWNLFEAMGGENSMPAWVNASPALAQSDYIHFTQKGANVVGQKLYQAISILEYDLELVQ